MVSRLEYHQQSSGESPRYAPRTTAASGDEKKRKVLDGFTHHKLLDRRKKEASRRGRSESPRLPAQRPPRAGGAKSSSGRVAKDRSRTRPQTYNDKTATAEPLIVSRESETRKVIAASRSRSSVAASDSNSADRHDGRGRSAGRVPGERFQRSSSTGQLHVSLTQSQDRCNVLDKKTRRGKVARDSSSAAGSRATNSATRLPKNVHRMPVPRSTSKTSFKTSNSERSKMIEENSSNTRPKAGSEAAGGPSKLFRTQSDVVSTKTLQVQTDPFGDMFKGCVSPTLAALLDPFPSPNMDGKHNCNVLSRNGHESSDTCSILDTHGEPQTETGKDHPESIQLEVEDDSAFSSNGVDRRTIMEGTNDQMSAAEPRHSAKRKLDRLLFFRNRALGRTTRGQSVPRSPRKWRLSSEKPLDSSRHSEPINAGPLETCSAASTPMNSKAAMNSSVDSSSLTESIKSTRAKSWMKLPKPLRRRNRSKPDNPSEKDIEYAEDSTAILPDFGTRMHENEMGEQKQMVSEDYMPNQEKQTPNDRKFKPAVEAMRPSRFPLSPRFPRSPIKAKHGGAGINKTEELSLVQAPLALITINNETEEAVEAVLGMPIEMSVAAASADTDPSVVHDRSDQLSANNKDVTGRQIEERCDVEDSRSREPDTFLRESAAEEDAGTKKGARGERLLQELYGGGSQSFDERPLTRFISSPKPSNNQDTEDFCDVDISRSHRKANRSFSFSEDEEECSEVHSEAQDEEYSDASSYVEESSSDEYSEDERSERSDDPYESDQSSRSDVVGYQSSEASTVTTLSVIKNLRLSRKDNAVTSDISENSALSEWSDMESFDSDEEESVSEKDVVQRLLLSKYKKKR